MSDNISKLPHDLKVEQALVGSIMVDNDSAAEVFERLQTDDFYSQKHQKIFEAALNIFANGSKTDLIGVAKTLESDGFIDMVGGAYYLTACTELFFSTTNIKYHCDLIKQLSLERKAIVESVRIKKTFERQDVSHDEKMEALKGGMLALIDESAKRDFVSVKQMVGKVSEKWESIHGKQDYISGVPSGFSQLDEAVLGWQPTDVIIIAANTSVGKSTLALNFAVNAARKGFPVGVFSLEMSSEQNVARIMASIAGINALHARKGRLSSGDWQKLAREMQAIINMNIFIDDSVGLTTLDLYGKMRRMIRDCGCKLFIVDYVQKLRGVGRFSNQYEELSFVSDKLKNIAKQLNVPIIAVSQFNRSATDDPKMSKIRGSGSIEQDADLVITIKPTNDNDKSSNIMNCQIDLEKHRNGPLTIFDAIFFKDKLLFTAKADDSYEKSIPPPQENWFTREN